MDVYEVSDRMIDFGERLSAVADAAKGKRRKSNGVATHWLVLPAAGAGLYALVRSSFFTKQAQGMVDEAKTLASDLPSDLMKTLRKTSERTSPGTTGAAARRSPPKSRRSQSRSSSQRRRPASRTKATAGG
jgi:hypothetical protein